MRKRISALSTVVVALLMICICATSLISVYALWKGNQKTSVENALNIGSVDVELDKELEGQTVKKYFNTRLEPYNGSFAPSSYSEALDLSEADNGVTIAEAKINVSREYEKEVGYFLTVDDSVYGNNAQLKNAVKLTCFKLDGDDGVATAWNGVSFENAGPITGILGLGVDTYHLFVVAEGAVAADKTFKFSLNVDSSVLGERRAITVIDGSADSSDAYAGAYVTLTPATITNKVFKEWQFTNTESGDPVDDIVASGNSFIMPDFAITVTAVFENAPSYTITVVGGTVTGLEPVPEEPDKYFAGTATVTPDTNDGRLIFDHWEDNLGNVLSTSETYSFEFNEDTYLEADFGNTVMINVVGGQGAGLHTIGGTATISSDYDEYNELFLNWTDNTGTIVSTASIMTFTVTAAHDGATYTSNTMPVPAGSSMYIFKAANAQIFGVETLGWEMAPGTDQHGSDALNSWYAPAVNGAVSRGFDSPIDSGFRWTIWANEDVEDAIIIFRMSSSNSANSGRMTNDTTMSSSSSSNGITITVNNEYQPYESVTIKGSAPQTYPAWGGAFSRFADYTVLSGVSLTEGSNVIEINRRSNVGAINLDSLKIVSTSELYFVPLANVFLDLTAPVPELDYYVKDFTDFVPWHD